MPAQGSKGKGNEMHAQEAAAILDRMTSRPHTRVRAWAEDSKTVRFQYDFEAYDSSPDWRGQIGGEGLIRLTSPAIRIDASKLRDAEAVRAAGLLALIEIETHELREFWRDGPAGPAPFHPHNFDGEARYARISQTVPAGAVSVPYPAPR